MNITASDPDGDIPSLDYSPELLYATFTDNLNGTATLVFNPGREVDPVATNIIITASSGELTAREQFTLTITPPDNPPTIDTITNVSVQAGGNSITVNITASDPDGDIPSLDYSPELFYATFTDRGDGTATLVFNPGREVDPVATNIIITASSGELTAREQFTLTITPPDRPPVIASISPNPVTVRAGESTNVEVMASDPDAGETPTLDLDGTQPTFVTIVDNRNGSATINIRPAPEEPPMANTINVVATSGVKATTNGFTLNIAPADNPPVIASISPNPVTVRAGEMTEVQVMASDPDAGETPTLDLDGTQPTFVTIADNRDGSATINIRPGEDETSDTITINVVATSGVKATTNDFILIIGSTVDGDGDGVLDIDDVDDDNDGLIEINTLDDLDNIRYNLAGTSYKTNATDPGNTNGAPGSRLKGYELVRGLDFNDPTSYESGMVNTAWTRGSGLLPIGNSSTRFTGILEGNGYTITNLMIRWGLVNIGLFGYIGRSGQVRNLGIENGVADYTGNDDGNNNIGLLAGASDGTIIAVHTSGIADGGNGNNDNVGGLLGWNNEGTITACYATGRADGGSGNNDNVGGLVGINDFIITACYATGMANGGNGNDNVGGLVGQNWHTITACYATGMANGGNGDNDNVGGLVGANNDTITASYGFGMVTGSGGVDRSGDASESIR